MGCGRFDSLSATWHVGPRLPSGRLRDRGTPFDAALIDPEMPDTDGLRWPPRSSGDPTLPAGAGSPREATVRSSSQTGQFMANRAAQQKRTLFGAEERN